MPPSPPGATAGKEPRHFTVAEEYAGQRLDRVLAEWLPEYSRSFVQSQIRAGNVAVDGKVAKSSHRVRAGEVLTVRIVEPPMRAGEPEDVELDIVHEDGDILAVNKPPGMVVHPTGASSGGTLVNALLHHSQELSDAGGEYRPGIVHRLDRNTSGVIVVAKNNAAHAHLAAQFKKRKVIKEYLAVAHGELELDSGEIILPVGRHRTVREKMAVRTAAGRDARTEYKVLERFRGFSYVSLHPETGRTHQLRVHLSSRGHPLVADRMYGGGKACYASQLQGRDTAECEQPLIKRQALHAHALSLAHPRTGEWMEFTAEPPNDFRSLIGALRAYRPL